MNFSIFLFWLVAFGQFIVCYALEEKGDIVDRRKIDESYRRDDNSILDDIRESETRRKISRRLRRRDSTVSTSTTQSSVRLAYERAMNQTISDYYAQRKAVMERYYARQREIIEKFGRSTIEPPKRTSLFVETTTDRVIDDRTTTSRIIDDRTTTDRIVDDRTTTSDTNVETTTKRLKIIEANEKRENEATRSIKIDEDETNENEKIKRPASPISGTSHWQSKDTGLEADTDFQARSSENVIVRASPRKIRTQEIPGYYKLGNFKGTKDEKVVYQHNLGVGVKGPSQLDATFEAIIEGKYIITAIEAFPYANTRANFSWIDGGPGTNHVKLELKGYENEGVSYTVKVWGVPE